MDPTLRLPRAPAPTVGYEDVPMSEGLALPGFLPGQSGGNSGFGVRAPAPAPVVATPAPAPAAPAPRPGATETLAARTGALVNEVDFPGFVAQLVHGTFDAIVDASIRQMES